MATPQTNIVLSGLVRRLIQDGVLNESDALDAVTNAQKNKTNLVSYLVENTLIDSLLIANSASTEFGVPLFDLSSMDSEQIPTSLISETLIKKHNAVPLFKRGKRLYVAVSDPTNLAALDEFKFHSGLTTEAVLVEEIKLNKTIEKIVEDKANEELGDFDDADLENLDLEAVDEESQDDAEAAGGADDAPIVRFVNKILLDAIKKGASDLHFEPYEKRYRVRFRIDGILAEVAGPPINLATRISARLKVMSKLDISEKRVPQDGRIKLKLSKTKAIDFRVSTLPTLFGEKIVMRILDPTSAQLGIDVLGYEPEQKELFLDAIHKPQGMVLVTGPTGSGKTVSLYTAVNIINTPERNISTAEDPVEINLEGVNQVNVNPKAGLNFSTALRAFLRQDPDIVLVGEIRDLETAEIAIKAAQTGHLVLSTLHTNSAPETLTRMVNMGVAPFNIATSVNLVIAQRLARRLCENCKNEADLPDDVLIKVGYKKEEIGTFKIFEPVGCDNCTNGYKGRVGVYQVMKVSETIGKIIMEGGNALDIAEQATKEGVNDLHRSALVKVMQGVTSLEEVNRVTQH
ncbi:type IV-A pilus assembly ATPase PilB [Aliikangiella coralliicola]|uniref:Type IV-A pilus assembly ATPase PilB n=1 Tax=Aliikangiella coralliicola TaxID=2592383 RepID=A0A545U011_9GAMM|nr:type IV-A pilus assembly ATPase PilB [Aliikangiella coralliicola]TQV82773.1 type IV-A pilus assembly ATPase PilB [Aliikangiella coralliicola]